jgi:hypothetical protein
MQLEQTVPAKFMNLIRPRRGGRVEAIYGYISIRQMSPLLDYTRESDNHLFEMTLGGTEEDDETTVGVGCGD